MNDKRRKGKGGGLKDYDKKKGKQEQKEMLIKKGRRIEKNKLGKKIKSTRIEEKKLEY